MGKEWWGDDDKCGECLYNKYDNREKCYIAPIKKVKTTGL